jgi:hypothetical protein
VNEIDIHLVVKGVKYKVDSVDIVDRVDIG